MGTEGHRPSPQQPVNRSDRALESAPGMLGGGASLIMPVCQRSQSIDLEHEAQSSNAGRPRPYCIAQVISLSASESL